MSMTLREEKLLSYLAGYFDGEGCIHISLQKRGKGGNHVLVCTIGTCDKDVPILYHKRFGGWYGEVLKPNGSGETKRYYRWQVVSKDAESFLNIIEPYLIAKKQQALLGLKMRKRMSWKGGSGHSLPEGEFNLREQVRKEMSLLKKRV